MPTSNPRLAHIHLGIDGGAERFFVRLVRGLAQRGIEQIVFVRPDRPWRAEIAEYCETHEFKYRRSFPKKQLTILRIRQIIRRFGAGAVLAWMNQAPRWIPAPRRDFRTFARLGDFPLDFKNFGRVETIIGNTPEVVHRCVEMGWPAERTRMISNFVQPGMHDPINRASASTPSDAVVVVALGRFVPRKGFDLLVEAIARTDNLYLWLIGDGPEVEPIKALVAQHGLEDRVRLLGWQPNGLPYIKAADILCCPSHEEPLGNVVLEGWAASKAVVATASEGPSWLIDHERTGLVTPLGEIEPLAQALARLGRDAELRHRLAAAGAAKLDEQFSEEAICQSYIDCLITPRDAQGQSIEMGPRP